MAVRVGAIDLTDTQSATMQTVEIEETISHPDYTDKYNDIALMKLKSPIKMNEFVRPACLATESLVKITKHNKTLSVYLFIY